MNVEPTTKHALIAAIITALLMTAVLLQSLSAHADEMSALTAPASVLYVCPSGCAYSSIQDAVDAASSGDTIKVASGTYTSVQARPAPLGYDGPSVITQVVYVSKTITIQGGYTTTNWITPDPDANPTRLDAQRQGRVIFVTGDITPTIEGLHITGGDAAGLGGDPWGTDSGGGVHVTAAPAIISNNHVFSNTAPSHGGGLYLESSHATLSGNIVSGNTAGYGGGLYLYYSNATLSENTVSSNVINWYGGGLYLEFSDATLSGNTVSGNTVSTWSGGGLFLYESDATLSGNTVTANTANCYGGGLVLSSSDATLVNDVVADNQANTAGSGLFIYGSSPHLRHTTIAHNTKGNGTGIHVANNGANYSTVALTNTILVSHAVGIYVLGGNTATLEATLWGTDTWANDTDWDGAGTVTTGTVNLWGAPAFVSPDAGDYHVGPTSTAIDWSLDKRARANRVRFAEKQRKMGEKWLQVVPSACFWPL